MTSSVISAATMQMSPELVKVVFRLYHVPRYIKKMLKDQGREIALLGSISQLGGWILERRLTAAPSSSEDQVWEVSAMLPACVSFKVSWLVSAGSDRILYWDPAEDHSVRVGYEETRVQMSWGRDPSYLLSHPSTLHLQTHYICPPGQTLVAVGSHPALGDWDPRYGQLAHEYPFGSGHWQVKVQVPTKREIEWKWVVVDAVTRRVERWETGANRSVFTNCELVRLSGPWNRLPCVLEQSRAVYSHSINMDKVAGFHDSVESGESLVTMETRQGTSSWRQCTETGEKPVVVTEAHKKAEHESRLRGRRSFIRKWVRVVNGFSQSLSAWFS